MFWKPWCMHGYTLNFSGFVGPPKLFSELGPPGLRFYIIIEYHRMQIIASIFIEYTYIHMRVGISMQVSNRISRKWLSTQIGVA